MRVLKWFFVGLAAGVLLIVFIIVESTAHTEMPSAGLVDLAPQAAEQVTERVRIAADVQKEQIAADDRRHERTVQLWTHLGYAALGTLAVAMVVWGALRISGQRNESEYRAMILHAEGLRRLGHNAEVDFVDGVWAVVDHDRREVVHAGALPVGLAEVEG